MTPDEVHAYWIGDPPTTPAELEAKGKQWFGGGSEVDAEIRTRFGAAIEQARTGALDDWHATPRGSLAWLILVDQFSRNVYRDRAEAFSCDLTAQRWARDGWDSGRFATLTTGEQLFAILPFEHAEDLDVQRRACALITQTAIAAPPLFSSTAGNWVTFARKHLDVIARFGRFPHRNAVLGRTSTPEETAYLAYCKLAGTWL